MGIELDKVTQRLDNLTQRLEKLENSKDTEILTLVEILANATFFGQMKKAICKYAKDGQCSVYIIDGKTKERLPFTAACRIKDCEEKSSHSHIELSNITCALCNETATGGSFEQ